MRKGIWGMIAGLALTVGLHAQGGGVGVGVGVGRGGFGDNIMIEQFQQAGTMGAGSRAFVMFDGNSGQAVTGRPVSGMEERKSRQTLGDGTVISTSESDLFFRDSAGRTRVETESHGRTIIVDPVAHTTVTLIAGTKTAHRMTMFSGQGQAKVGGALAGLAAPELAKTSATYSVDTGSGFATVIADGVVAPRVARAGKVATDNMQHEELGVQSFNGVLATGTRNTLTIPEGQIGNDRDIHVVNERWYSDDLQMLVKTVNSDPRFGENTYELTNVSRSEPDPALFQIPPDYTVVEMAAGKAMPPPPPAINK